jgi:Raf kinase inhibitor-like YbhB/YbcL family protein
MSRPSGPPRRGLWCAVLLAGPLCAGCGGGRDGETDPGAKAMKIDLTSPAFQEGQTIPRQCTADGKDVSPPLRWGEPPQGTRGFALVCEDPDAPRGTWTHWVIFDLLASSRGLDEGVPTDAPLGDGEKQGKNDFGKNGYGGPSPPRGKPHRYFFKLYALDAPTGLSEGATRADLLNAIKGHVLAEGQLMGLYGR